LCVQSSRGCRADGEGGRKANTSRPFDLCGLHLHDDKRSYYHHFHSSVSRCTSHKREVPTLPCAAMCATLALFLKACENPCGLKTWKLLHAMSSYCRGQSIDQSSGMINSACISKEVYRRSKRHTKQLSSMRALSSPCVDAQPGIIMSEFVI
jgi:hypothetical protein